MVIYAQRATPYQVLGPCIGHIYAHRRSQSSIPGYHKVAKRNLFITESYRRAMCVYVGIYNPAQLSAVCVLTCSHPVALCHLFTVFLRCLLYVKMFCAQVPPFDSSVPIPPPTQPPARGLPRNLFSTSTPVSILLPAQFYAGAFKSQTPPMHANLERRAAKRAAVKNAPFVNGHENS